MASLPAIPASGSGNSSRITDNLYFYSIFQSVTGWINSSNRTANDAVLDPCQVEDGWFEILLPSLQLVLTDAVPDHEKNRAEYTLNRLHLRDDERVIRQRREWYRMYQDGELTIDGLERKAPLIARAIRKQQVAGDCAGGWATTLSPATGCRAGVP